MWGGEGEESPEGALVRTEASSAAPKPHTSPSRHWHSRTHARPPDSQATDGQTNPLPAKEGPAPSQHLLSCHPQSLLGGGSRPPQTDNPWLPGPSYSQSTEQPPPAKVAKVAAKKPEVNLSLDSAAGEGSSTTPGMHPKTITLGEEAQLGHSALQFTPFFSVTFFGRGG